MKKIINFLFLSCQKATILVEKKFHFKLSMKEKIQLKAHLMMCDACTKFSIQSHVIEKGLQDEAALEVPPVDLSRLKSKISNKLDRLDNDSR